LQILAEAKADGQPAKREHGGVLAAAPNAEATSGELTVGRLTAYTALAAYLVVERASRLLKDERYAKAVARHKKDHDNSAFLAELAAASQEHRAILREALRQLREAIRKREVMNAADAEAFWYQLRLLQGDAKPAA
jgi:hypothetical protein